MAQGHNQQCLRWQEKVQDKSPVIYHLSDGQRPGWGPRWSHLIPQQGLNQISHPHAWDGDTETQRGQHHVQGHTAVSLGDRSLRLPSTYLEPWAVSTLLQPRGGPSQGNRGGIPQPHRGPPSKVLDSQGQAGGRGGRERGNGHGQSGKATLAADRNWVLMGRRDSSPSSPADPCPSEGLTGKIAPLAGAGAAAGLALGQPGGCGDSRMGVGLSLVGSAAPRDPDSQGSA